MSSTEPVCSTNQDELKEEIVEGKFEYEFSCLFDGALCFVHLFDTNDVSACERILHRPVRAEEITYSEATGNAFIEDAPFKYTFTKEPYKRTWTHAVTHTNTVGRSKATQTASDILSSL